MYLSRSSVQSACGIAIKFLHISKKNRHSESDHSYHWWPDEEEAAPLDKAALPDEL